MSSGRLLAHRTAVAAALLVTVLWSSSWVLVRWGLDDEALEPITFAALRYGLASLLLVAWVAAGSRHLPGPSRFDRSLVSRILVLGVLFYAVTQGAQFVAIDHQPAATTALLLSFTPLLVAGLAGRTLAESPSRRQLLGAVTVVAGAWLYFAGDLGGTVLGMLAALIALGANVASALVGRHVNRTADVHPVVVTTASMAMGSVILIVVGVASEGIPTISTRAWLIIFWLAAVNTALAFSLWNFSLQRLSALESAGINTTMLVQIAVLAWLFLDEDPGLIGLGGIALVSIGVLLTQARSASRSPRTAAPSTRPPSNSGP